MFLTQRVCVNVVLFQPLFLSVNGASPRTSLLLRGTMAVIHSDCTCEKDKAKNP